MSTTTDADDTDEPNGTNWHDVATAVLDKLADVADIMQDMETINDWSDVQEWTANYTPSGSLIRFEHDSGAWVEIRESRKTDGYSVYTCGPSERSVIQRFRWSYEGHILGLDTCQNSAISRMLVYTRDGEF